MNTHCFIFISDSTTILIVGGKRERGFNSREVTLIGDKKCSFPQLPIGVSSRQPSMILTNDEEILVCEGFRCKVMRGQRWVTHSDLNEITKQASAVTMDNGIYIFGGVSQPTKTQFLPNGSTRWQEDSEIPKLSGEFFSGHNVGCAVKISDFEVLLIGGGFHSPKKRIIKFNIKTKEWLFVGELRQERRGHSCVVMNDVIIISGGMETFDYLASTELISLADLTNIRTVGSLNEERAFHGMAIAHIRNKPTLLAFGGEYKISGRGWPKRDSIEIWNPDSETWTLATDMKLNEKKSHFGYLSVPTNLLCQ